MTWENPGVAGTAMPNCVSKSDAIGTSFPPFGSSLISAFRLVESAKFAKLGCCSGRDADLDPLRRRTGGGI